MHKTHVIPSSLPHIERTAGSGIGACFQLVLRHARKPRSLPALFWKNIKYAFASRRRGRSEDPTVWNEIGRGLAERGRHEEALACYEIGILRVGRRVLVDIGVGGRCPPARVDRRAAISPNRPVLRRKRERLVIAGDGFLVAFE